MIDSCARSRLMMAKNVSMIGMPAARIGTSSDTNSAALVTAKSEAIPSENPRNSAPESPIKMEAG